jgi:hypothetical protein
MSSYLVLFLCRACLDVHQLGNSVELEELPGGGCVEDLYRGKALPPALQNVMVEVYCPRVGPVEVDRRSVYIYAHEG